MKKLLVALAAVLVTATSYGQGSVLFDTIGLPTPVPIFDVGGVNGPGGGANAQLYFRPTAGGAWAVIPNSLTTFFSASGEGAKYVTSVTATVPGVAGGSTVDLQVRAWKGGASWEAASGGAGAFSRDIDGIVNGVVLGGAGDPPSTPAELIGLQSFTLVPEPSTIALGLLGAAALLLRRRK